jgi:hypothetical protein
LRAEGWAYKEIGVRLGVTADAVKNVVQLRNTIIPRDLSSEERKVIKEQMTVDAMHDVVRDGADLKVVNDQQGFPKLGSIPELMRPVAESILKHVVNTNGKLTYAHDAYAFGIEDTGGWIEFCQEVFEKSGRIARAFDKPQKFKIHGTGVYTEIVYGDGTGIMAAEERSKVFDEYVRVKQFSEEQGLKTEDKKTEEKENVEENVDEVNVEKSDGDEVKHDED